MENKNIKKQVKKLAKQKKYNDIYGIYGQKWFKKYTPEEWQKKDKEKLRKEGKFIDIYNKYGEFDKQEVQKTDIKQEIGKEPTIGQKIKLWYKKILGLFLAESLTIAATTSTSLNIVNGLSTDNIIENNSKKYEKQIEEYEKEIKEYAENIDQKNYTDLEIFMKLMQDMYQTTRGYGEPEIDAQGYYGMDLQEGGIGVCRNMADNIADKLNEINPDYNARSIAVIANYSSVEYNNVEQKNVIDDDTTLITRGNEERIYKDGELVRIAAEENDRKISQKYENGELISTDVTYQEGDTEITDTYEENRLSYKSMKKDDEYISESYDENGNVSRRTIADEDIEKTTFYNDDGSVYIEKITEGKQQTIIRYENGQIVSKETEELEEGNNIYITLQELKKQLKIEKATRANHAVVIVDVEKDNATIILDPTYVTIGVYKDGKITMFNENEEKEPIKRDFSMDVTLSGTENFIDIPKEFVQSFLNPLVSLEKLEEKYGVEAQNKALAKLEREEKKKNFKEELKVDGQVAEDEIIYNVTEGKAKVFGKDYDLTK